VIRRFIDVVVGDEADDIASKINTQISLNTALAGKVVASGTAAAGSTLFISTTSDGAQYSLRAEASSSNATTALFSVSAGDSRGVSRNLLNFTVNTVNSSNVTANATVASGTYSSHAALITAMNTALLSSFGTVDGGGSVSDVSASVVNTNQVQFATRDEGSSYSIKLNAGTAGTHNLRNVLKLTDDTLALKGTDALIQFDNYTNTISAVKYGSTGTVTLKNAEDGNAGQGTIDMTVNTAANGINVGNLLLDVKAAKFDVRLDGGPATSVTAGQQTTIFNADRTESLFLSYVLTSQGGTETIKAKEPKNLEGLKVGDMVEITYSQALAVSLDKSGKGK
jgi:hypothetical protein